MTRAEVRAGRVALLLSYVGFVSLGLPDSVLGAAWPVMRRELGFPLDAGGVIVMVAMGGTIVSSAASGHVLRHASTGIVLASSSLLAAVALGLYASAADWPRMLIAALLAGFGGGAVDAVLNRFIAENYPLRHMTWLHGCWGVGATLGPTTLAVALRAGHSRRDAYLVLALAESTLALAFLATRGRWQPSDARSSRAKAEGDVPPGRPALSPGMYASVGCFLVYSGVEASIGLWGASLLIEVHGASLALASQLIAIYWGLLTAGRFLFGLIVARLGQSRLLALCFWTALIALTGLSVPALPLAGATLAIGLLGLALAPIYPLLMHDTPARFGADVSPRLVGYQVAAAATGIAAIPWSLGALAQRTSLQSLPPLLVALAALLLALDRARTRGRAVAETASGR